MTLNPLLQQSIDALVDDYARLSQVEAVALGGSLSTAIADRDSDIDLYLYTTAEVSLAERRRIVLAHSSGRSEIDNRNWEPGDEWIDRDSGRHIDVMWRDLAGFRQSLRALLLEYQASIGYSSCLWFNLLNARILFDRNDQLTQLQQWAERDYPPELQRAIIDKNLPLLKSNLSSYYHQLELAAKRDDGLSLQHRTTALLASVFDILFALNRQPHPGEKRQLFYCRKLEHQPLGFEKIISEIVATGVGDSQALLARIDALIASLEQLLLSFGFKQSSA